MTDYLTEQEQIEILKKWIKQYSFVILAGVLVAIIAVTGYRYWQKRQYKILSHASAVYDEMLSLREQNDLVATNVQASKIVKHYPQTIYGQMAAFVLAKDSVQQKNYAEAEKQLQWIMDHSRIASFKQIARLRLARIQIAKGQAPEAFKILQTIDDKTFVGLIDEVKGDAYLALQNIPKARELYQQALTELPEAERARPLLQMKYDNLVSVK